MATAEGVDPGFRDPGPYHRTMIGYPVSHPLQLVDDVVLRSPVVGGVVHPFRGSAHNRGNEYETVAAANPRLFHTVRVVLPGTSFLSGDGIHLLLFAHECRI